MNGMTPQRRPARPGRVFRPAPEALESRRLLALVAPAQAGSLSPREGGGPAEISQGPDDLDGPAPEPVVFLGEGEDRQGGDPTTEPQDDSEESPPVSPGGPQQIAKGPQSRLVQELSEMGGPREESRAEGPPLSPRAPARPVATDILAAGPEDGPGPTSPSPSPAPQAPPTLIASVSPSRPSDFSTDRERPAPAPAASPRGPAGAFPRPVPPNPVPIERTRVNS